MWFKLTGDERIMHRCATECCDQQPTWKLEANGVGSIYCSACKDIIEVADEWPRPEKIGR